MWLVVGVFTAKVSEKSSTENLISGLQPAAPSKGFPQCTGIYPVPLPYTPSFKVSGPCPVPSIRSLFILLLSACPQFSVNPV